MAQRLIDEYLEAAGHRYDQKGPLFRPVKNNISDTLDKSLDLQAVYTCIIPQIRKRNRYHGQLGRVQDFLGHLNIQHTVIYTASKLTWNLAADSRRSASGRDIEHLKKLTLFKLV